MITYREDFELHYRRENHMACLIGWVVGLSVVVLCVLLVMAGWSPWLLQLAGIEFVLSVLLFLMGQRQLRRIREIEEFI